MPASWPSPPDTRPYLAVLEAASARGFDVGRTKLAKLLYLCDLEAVERFGEPFTGIVWKWENHGPYNAQTIRSVEDLLVQEGHITVTPEWVGPEHRQQTLVLKQDRPTARALEQRLAELVGEVVGEFGGLNATELIALAYTTPAMEAAQQSGARGDTLDIEYHRPIPDVAGVVSAYADVLEAAGGRLSDEEGDPAELEALIDEMDRFRRAVDSDLLADDS